MPYNFVADSFHTKKLCTGLSFKRSAILDGYRLFCVFWAFPLPKNGHGFAHWSVAGNDAVVVEVGWDAIDEFSTSLRQQQSNHRSARLHTSTGKYMPHTVCPRFVEQFSAEPYGSIGRHWSSFL